MSEELNGFKLTRWEKIYYPVYRFFNKLRYLHKDIYWFSQRHIRGYSNSDIWDVGYYLGEHILKCLKAFRTMELQGIPYMLKDNNEPITEEEWLAILDKMIAGWDFILHAEDRILFNIKDKSIVDPITFEEYEKLCPKYEADAMLFVKYIHALWD